MSLVDSFQSISISNHIAVRVIWDVSPELFFINFEINPSVSEGDLKIDEKKQGSYIPNFT